MKILFTGGGSGGHFYPIIAVAEAIDRVVKEKRLLPLRRYLMADAPFDERSLFERNIIFKKIYIGKVRRYASIKNFFDLFRTAVGMIQATLTVFNIFPDVVFGTGGYASFPALFAARLFRIPVAIHESDSVPGWVNRWAGKFAMRIAVSFAEAAAFFPREKVAHTGHPVRVAIRSSREGAEAFLQLEAAVPTVLILGGSQGAVLINELIIRVLPDLVERYQVIHQTGRAHKQEVEKLSAVVLEDHPHRSRYHPFDYLTDQALAMAAGSAKIVISRSGSTIFEIASWGLPSIIIPITASGGDHQRANAWNYARSGACIVLEEENCTPAVFLAEIQSLLADTARYGQMAAAARAFSKPDAAEKVAREILGIALSHET